MTEDEEYRERMKEVEALGAKEGEDAIGYLMKRGWMMQATHRQLTRALGYDRDVPIPEAKLMAAKAECYDAARQNVERLTKACDIFEPLSKEASEVFEVLYAVGRVPNEKPGPKLAKLVTDLLEELGEMRAALKQMREADKVLGLGEQGLTVAAAAQLKQQMETLRADAEKLRVERGELVKEMNERGEKIANAMGKHRGYIELIPAVKELAEKYDALLEQEKEIFVIAVDRLDEEQPSSYSHVNTEIIGVALTLPLAKQFLIGRLGLTEPVEWEEHNSHGWMWLVTVNEGQKNEAEYRIEQHTIR